jgi:hypothetical protein
MLLLVWAAPRLTGQEVAYEGSMSMSSGNYIFTQRTNTFGLTTGLAVTAGRLTVRASIPIWLQNSTVITASAVGLPGSGAPTGPGMGGVPSGGSSSGTVGDSGQGGGRGRMAMASGRVDVPASGFTDYRAAVGDPLLSGSFALAKDGRVGVNLTAMVKAPVSDTTGFGTGKWDVGAAAGSSVQLDGRTALGLDVAWWHLGDLPGLDFRDPWTGTISASRLVGDTWGLMLFASGSTAAIEGFDPPLTVGGGLMRLRGGRAWGLQAGAGLTETSPDFTLAGFWRVRL